MCLSGPGRVRGAQLREVVVLQLAPHLVEMAEQGTGALKEGLLVIRAEEAGLQEEEEAGVGTCFLCEGVGEVGAAKILAVKVARFGKRVLPGGGQVVLQRPVRARR